MKAEETPKLVEWLLAHKKINQVDFEPFRRNQIQVFVAESEGEILCFIPVEHILRYDALAPMPEISKFQMTRVCEEMTKFIKTEAKKYNFSKILVEPNSEQFAGLLEKLGYQNDNRKHLLLNFNEG